MRPLRFIRLWKTLGWLGVCLIVYQSLTPSPPELVGFPGGDKVLHFAAYATLMLWFGLIYLPGKEYLGIGFGLIMMGIILEFIQGATGYRSRESLDMLSNALGVLSGWSLARTRFSSALACIERMFHGRPEA